ncbi:unnamed protein product, partial [Allacma fusca]
VAVLWVAASIVKLELVRVAGILIGIGLSTGEPSIYHYVNEHLKLTTVTGAVLTVSSGVVVISYRHARDFILGLGWSCIALVEFVNNIILRPVYCL